ncbi:hypothetical protein [Bradyrhizobium sp. HKCCYLR20261]|uniref:hypothetical protein n=1 Tax=Bradyrhizobium sp. HKCCYLR20261 TaxID=3420760 RepID=UPI003EB78B5A
MLDWRRIVALAILGSLLAACVAEEPQVKLTPEIKSVNELEQQLVEALEKNKISSSRSSEELAKQIADQLRTAQAEYNRPKDLELGYTFPVFLYLNWGKPFAQTDREELFKGLEGEIRTAKLLISRDLEAKLAGPPDTFEITPRGTTTRSILDIADRVSWEWDVKPLKPGKGVITLEVTSYVQNGQDRRAYPIRVLQDTWEVQAHGLEWWKYEISQLEPIRGFIYSVVAGGSGVLAWFGISGRKKRRPEYDT